MVSRMELADPSPVRIMETRRGVFLDEFAEEGHAASIGESQVDESTGELAWGEDLAGFGAVGRGSVAIAPSGQEAPVSFPEKLGVFDE